MFSYALKEASHYTAPVIVSKRLLSGEVTSGCATFFAVNAGGWVLTAAHVLKDYLDYQAKKREIAAYKAALSKIKKAGLKGGQRTRALGRLAQDPKWITKVSYWWGASQFKMAEWILDEPADLALVKLRPFDVAMVAAYPVFRDPADELLPGTSLCRLGFPFHNVSSTYDDKTDSFQFAPGDLPVPRFPLDGILTRVVMVQAENERSIPFIETSSPGLQGQSGGPVLDVKGRVCGLQSHTVHFALGFNPTVKVGSKEVRENQFLNVGWATHVSEILKFLEANKVTHQVV